jgi:hypothetical protein
LLEASQHFEHSGELRSCFVAASSFLPSHFPSRSSSPLHYTPTLYAPSLRPQRPSICLNDGFNAHSPSPPSSFPSSQPDRKHTSHQASASSRQQDRKSTTSSSRAAKEPLLSSALMLRSLYVVFVFTPLCLSCANFVTLSTPTSPPALSPHLPLLRPAYRSTLTPPPSSSPLPGKASTLAVSPKTSLEQPSSSRTRRATTPATSRQPSRPTATTVRVPS